MDFYEKIFHSRIGATDFQFYSVKPAVHVRPPGCLLADIPPFSSIISALFGAF
jgi:hypothetical protein